MKDGVEVLASGDFSQIGQAIGDLQCSRFSCAFSTSHHVMYLMHSIGVNYTIFTFGMGGSFFEIPTTWKRAAEKGRS